MNHRLKVELIDELFFFKTNGIKPNFSALSRIFGFDRATIRKYYHNLDEIIKKSQVKTNRNN